MSVFSARPSASSCFLKVDLREEGLVRFQVVPSIGIERRADNGEIPIRLAGAAEAEGRRKLADIGREVTRPPHPIGQQTNARRHWVAVIAV